MLKRCHFDRREKSYTREKSTVDLSRAKDFSLVPRFEMAFLLILSNKIQIAFIPNCGYLHV
jgi:hypothetical protein